MRRIVSTILAPLTLLCLFLTFAPVTLAAPAAEGNFTRYIPEADYHEGMTQEEIDRTAHTIYWAQGIKPPAMPHTLQEAGSASTMGSFWLIDGDNRLDTPEDAAASQKMFQYYIAPYQPGSGWYDVKKAAFHDSNPDDALLDGVDDNSMCYAASAANLVQWWLDQNRDLVSRYVELLNQEPQLIPASPKLADPRTAGDFYLAPGLSEEESLMVRNNPVFRRMRQGFSHNKNGGYCDLAMDFFFNGYALLDPDGPPNITDVNFHPDSRGGLFYPALGTSVITNRVATAPSYSYSSTMFKTWLNNGIGINLAYLLRGSGHAITLWGAEYDENDKLCAVFIVDNNDGAGDFGVIHGERHMFSMKRYQALNYNNLLMISGKRVTEPVGKGTGNTIYMLELVDLAREPLEYFLENKVQMPLPAGQKNYFPPDMAPPAHEYEDDHQHHYVPTVNGNRIEQRCDVPDCGKVKGWVELNITDPGPFTYHGGSIRPQYRIYFKGNWDGGTNVSVRYQDNIHAGTGKILFSVAGQTAQAVFTILPAAMPDTDAVPELAVGPTSHSVTLKQIEGHEFSRDGLHWQADGLFDGLEPGQSYTFQVRRAAPDPDHTPTQSPHTLTVTTLTADLPAEPAWTIRSVSFDGSRANVVISSAERHDAVTLMVAGYDRNGRMTGAELREIPAGSGGVISEEDLLMSSETAEVRAFLLQDGVPLCSFGSSLDS